MYQKKSNSKTNSNTSWRLQLSVRTEHNGNFKVNSKGKDTLTSRAKVTETLVVTEKGKETLLVT